VAQKLLENSVRVPKSMKTHILCALTRGSLAWLKFRLVRFFSEVMHENLNKQEVLDRPYIKHEGNGSLKLVGEQYRTPNLLLLLRPMVLQRHLPVHVATQATEPQALFLIDAA